MKERLDLYPVVVLQDRYGGVYSGGDWIAIAEGDLGRRFTEVLDGAHGEDCDAMEFWESPPEFVAVGDTPDAAVANLHAKIPADGAA